MVTQKDMVKKYLSEHPNTWVKTSQILEDLKIKKSALSDIIKELKAEGHQIDRKYGMIKYVPSDGITLVGDIKNSDVRQWLILLVLSTMSSKAVTQKAIEEHLEKVADYSWSTYKDLTELVKNGYLIKSDADASDTKDTSKYVYKLSQKAPELIFMSDYELNTLIGILTSDMENMKEDGELKDLLALAKTIFGWEEEAYRPFGRSNRIDEVQIQHLKKFIAHPYKEKALNIKYKGQNGEHKDIFYTAFINYGRGTNCFYGLFVNANPNIANDDTKKIKLLRLESISSISPSDKVNPCYKTEEYLDIYRDMFGSEYDGPKQHVTVIFKDNSEIEVIEKLVDMYLMRKEKRKKEIPKNVTDKLDTEQDMTRVFPEICEEGSKYNNKEVKNKKDEYPIIYKTSKYKNEYGIPYTIVYEDEIIGMNKFKRMLREFGSSALALEPDNLRNDMRDEYEKICNLYKDDENAKV